MSQVIRSVVPALPWDQRERVYCPKCERYAGTVSAQLAKAFREKKCVVPCSWCEDEEDSHVEPLS